MATRGRQPPKKVCFGNGLPVKLRVYKGLGRGLKIGFLKIRKRRSPPWDETLVFMCMYLGRYKKEASLIGLYDVLSMASFPR